MTNIRQVGLIGVGLMGHGIASSLLRAGHHVSFLEHPGNQPVEDLLAAGATALSSGKAVAQSAEVVILCVTGSPQVEAVLFEPNGVLEGLKPNSVVVDCSTALPS
ncbi:MAG TPA: NAD(P)-dependent oxidoreductase, partial [Halomonas sp.]|nr:NAD(P)-dependent oxidoreductase [Halomonas sp.]